MIQCYDGSGEDPDDRPGVWGVVVDDLVEMVGEKPEYKPVWFSGVVNGLVRTVDSRSPKAMILGMPYREAQEMARKLRPSYGDDHVRVERVER